MKGVLQMYLFPTLVLYFTLTGPQYLYGGNPT